MEPASPMPLQISRAKRPAPACSAPASRPSAANPRSAHAAPRRRSRQRRHRRAGHRDRASVRSGGASPGTDRAPAQDASARKSPVPKSAMAPPACRAARRGRRRRPRPRGRSAPARSRNAAPSSVSDSLRVVRCSRLAPTLRSSSASRSLTTDFDSRRRRAASLIDPASATATKVAMPSSFIVRLFQKTVPQIAA